MLTSFKDKFTGLSLFLAKIFIKLNFPPNVLTLLGFFSAVASFFFIFSKMNFLAGLFLLLNGFFDLVDGVVARQTSTCSKFGAVLDSTLDRFSDFLIIAGLSLSFSTLPELVVGFTSIHSTLMVSYVKAKAESEGIKRLGGFIERPERLIILVITLFSQQFFWGLLVLAVLSYVTIVQRLFFVHKKLKEENFSIN